MNQTSQASDSAVHFDVIVVGAGISGIGAACHLAEKCPTKRFAIFEGRASVGGTWDLFRYPGIRSDSDMHTLGFSFKPWVSEKAIADGPAIMDYLRETVREHGIADKIRFGHRVKRASWSTDRAEWTLDVATAEGETRTYTCQFLFMCAGYYNYEQGHAPSFKGAEKFKGRIVHPQFWTDDIEYRDKDVVVIGSGATAVTLVPAMAPEARHVTMLQRSPTYVVSLPTRDAIGDKLRHVLPEQAAHTLTRWKNILYAMFIFQVSRRRPKGVKKRIMSLAREALGPGFDVDTHFNPRYNPWEQRLCIAADGDLFEALKSGKASIVTDTIDTFTEHGIRLTSGEELRADLVVMATGLQLQFLGGMELWMDGQKLTPSRLMSYKGAMLAGVPNLAAAVGYTNASWTLKADLISQFVCRLLNHMDHVGAKVATPRKAPSDVGELPLLDLSSGYVQRGVDSFPKQGSKGPWKVHQNYLRDVATLGLGRVDDPSMELSGRA